MLTDFRNSFTGRLSGKFATKSFINIPPHLEYVATLKKAKVAHTRLPSVGFRSWSRFLAVNLQVAWVINPAVGCHYFPPGLQLLPATLKRAATNFAAWWTEARWVWTVCLRLLPDSDAAAILESSTLTTRLPSHYVATLPCEISMFKQLQCSRSNWSKLPRKT